ncbi:MAG: hypothetical protein JWM95_48 [Gemmatimonadetes bacterium]|nr:hypothetical protein [Gemmatimonadota bacterium]
MKELLLHFWAWPSTIAIDPLVCPVSPSGVRQTAQAVVQSADWQRAYGIAFAVTALIALAAVFLTFETRAMGDRFRKRWWRSLGVTTLLITIVVFVWLTRASVQTSGCEYGAVATTIPTSYALSRASVAVLQTPLLFILWTALVTLLGKVTRRSTWYNNSQFGSLFHR